nr:uncharacterized protein LOC113689292 [Coffea arabica]
MAALQPLAEGQGASPSARKSFSQLFSQPSSSPIQIRPVTSYKGETAVIFPGMMRIDWQCLFTGLWLESSHTVDFNRLWTRGIWQLGRFPMRVFRWTRDFHVQKESSLAPVWATLPALPVHFFDKHSLFSILSLVGKPLFLDAATAARTGPSVAWVCVEVHLVKPICSRVWVAVEGEVGFWQQIVIDDLPSYCSKCWRLGHSVGDCKREDFVSRQVSKSTTVASQVPQAVADGKMQVEVSVKETHVATNLREEAPLVLKDVGKIQCLCS